MLLHEFDPLKKAVINPSDIMSPLPDFPESVVSVFSYRLFERLLDFFGREKIAETHDVDGIFPVYAVNYKGRRFAFAKGRLGAPACVGTFEDVFALGGKRLILLGNCGVLDKNIDDCSVIIPDKALRDEGTSFHYAPPSDVMEVNKKYAELFKKICREHGYSYTVGTTWTTDAFYRETPEKIARRREAGAITVDMECAAVQAFCDFRGIEFFQFFYAGDNLDAAVWDPRSLSGAVRLDDKEKIALLAFELAYRIEEDEQI